MASPDPGHASSPTRRYLFYGITAIAGSGVLYSFYRWYRIRDQILHADSPRPFNQDSQAKASKAKASKAEPETPKNREDKVTDKPQEASILPEWSEIGDKIADAVVPDWAQSLPEYVAKLQTELSLEPGTLSDEIWGDAHDPRIHPEIAREASVRVSDDLCDEENHFLSQRKPHTRRGLAKYLDLPEEDVHPDDVPVIGICGSGGGLRALVAGTSSFTSTQESGLFDCATYTAGVSGSCWLQLLYHSSLVNQDFGKLLNHLKSRIGTHIAFPPPVLNMLTSAPTHKYLISGAFEKWHGVKNADFGLVDVYGLLLGARLLVPKGELGVNDEDLKLSSQRKNLKNGEHPLPIFSCVRHEIPAENAAKKDEKTESIHEMAKKEAWFQWLEFTPYEFWCEEFGAGIPTWSVGRQFHAGHTISSQDSHALPEIRTPLLMGIWGSAFCATLSHYYKEIRPVVKGLTAFSGLDSLLEEHNEDLVKVHPVKPAEVPNYALGMKDVLPPRCPDSIHGSKEIQLMDAGMSNNLPIYPLLRPGRDVDIIVAFDASADVKKDNWLRVADGYARQRGIRGWPIGCGWPDQANADAKDAGMAVSEAEDLTAGQASQKLNQAAKEESKAGGKDEKSEPASGKEEEPPGTRTDLGYCNVWVGTTEERKSTKEPPQSKQVEEEWELMQPNAGICVIYFPFTANPKVEGVDPETSEFMSTWNFVYTPENIDQVVSLARANFKEGEERTKKTIRAIYERKKRLRLDREKRGEED